MSTRATLKPGERGTKRLAAKYGERLLRVRYRIDRKVRRRYKTVELIEEELEWRARGDPPDPDELVAIRVEYAEVGIRRRVKQAGGFWDGEARVWRLPRYRAELFGLEGRIVDA